MKVNLISYPSADDWMEVKRTAFETVGKEAETPPVNKWKSDILEARHSPIRELRFMFDLIDVPYWVSVHLCRHKHAQPYVRSQRNDRQNDYDRTKAPQDAPVNMGWSMNAEELMIVANKRLCMLASPETREVVRMMCDEVIKVCPEFAPYLVPMCEYHGGICHEMKPCGKSISTKGKQYKDVDGIRLVYEDGKIVGYYTP